MRPTEYDPNYCEKVIEFGKQGKSRAWIADELGVVRNTLKNWEAQYPEFLIAMERAQLAAQRWWEDKGQTGMETREFNAPIWSRSMAARFPDDWREKVAHVGGDKGDNPIQQEIAVTADAFTSRIIGAHARARDEGATGSDPAADQG